MSPINEQNINKQDWKPGNVEIVDEEHVENKILDGSRRLLPSDDILVTSFVFINCTAFGKEMLYSVDIVKELRSFKLWLGDLVQQRLFIL